MIPWLWMGLALAAEPVSLDAAFAAARSAPDAQLAQAASDLGRSERLAAQAWSNPSVDYQGYGRTKGTADAINGQQHQVDVGIPLPVTGELIARLRRGRLAEQLGQARASSRHAQLAEAVAQAWYGLLAAQEREAVVEQALGRVVRLVDLTEGRAAEGAARRWDVDRIRLARVALDRQLAAVRQDRKGAVAVLAALLGDGGGDLVAIGDLGEALDIAPDVESLDGSPFVVEARVALEHRDMAAREARRSRIPEPELRLGGYWTTDGVSSSVVAGLGWDLPLLDRGQGRVAAAHAERFAAEAELRRAEAWVIAERRAIRSAMEDLGRTLAATSVPAGTVLAAAEVAWAEGEASLLELVDAVSAEVQQRLDAVELALALRLLELRLATLDGTLGDRVAPR